MSIQQTPAQRRRTHKRVWQEGTPEQRKQAATLFAQDAVQADVAREVGVSKPTICRWYKDWESRGKQEVGPPGRRGGVSRLSPLQLDQLRTTLLQGPRAYGYPTELWTLARIRDLIEKLFGIDYCTGSVWYIMRQIGFSAQKPVKRGKKRSEEAVLEWKEKTWPAIVEKGGA